MEPSSPFYSLKLLLLYDSMTKNLLIIVLLLYGCQNLLAQSLSLTTTSPKFQQTLSYEVGGEEPCFNGN